LTHVQQPPCQDNGPDIGPQLAYQANRVGVAERLPEPAGQQSSEVDLALRDAADQRLRALEGAMVTTAKPPEANPRYGLQTVPGIGKLLRLVLVYELPDSTRVPRGQDVVSSGRVGTCAQASAGKRDGTSGTTIGTAYLKWAVSEAAVLFLRNNPAGHTSLARLEPQHGKDKAVTGVAHKRARAVYDLLNRGTAFDMAPWLRGYGSGAGEPMAELGHQGAA